MSKMGIHGELWIQNFGKVICDHNGLKTKKI